jgi:pyrroline-5-carboxylate reductase
MGEAILGAMLSNHLVQPKEIIVSDIDAAKLDKVKKRYKADVTLNNSIAANSSDVLIIAVKPQDIDATLIDMSGSLNKGKLLISIAAGVTTKKILSIIGKDRPVVRVMPNMPALIKEGFSAISFSKSVGKKEAEFARKIFSCLGEIVEVKEKDLNAITAVSGSGPAYFFYIVETLIDAGVSMGLTMDIARKAAIKTALGSTVLLSRSEEEPAALRKRVTSKGGTTEAAFKVFNKKGLARVMREGIKAAKKRSKELSGG